MVWLEIRIYRLDAKPKADYYWHCKSRSSLHFQRSTVLACADSKSSSLIGGIKLNVEIYPP